MDKVIDCKSIAQKVKDDVRERAKNKKYKLTVFTNPYDEAGKTYVKNKKKVCEEVGIEFEEIPLYKQSNRDDLYRVLMNESNPMIIQLPMAEDLSLEITDNLMYSFNDYFRDADGFLPDSFVDPATPKGIIKILDEIGFNLEGKHVVVMGRSNIVGKPVARMCLERNATVTIVHSKTKNVKNITNQADVLIVAIGKPKLINEGYVKEGSIVIDVGINRDPETNKLCGDVDFDSVFPKVSKITKVPGGVGLLTTACLVENVAELYERKKGEK